MSHLHIVQKKKKLAVEALPLELQRNYTLIRQLDESAEELLAQVAAESKSLTRPQKKLTTEERKKRLEHIGQLLNETLKKGEEKLALAKSTYDTVSIFSSFAEILERNTCRY